MKRATALANSYSGACIRIAKAGPDNVDLAMSVYFVQQFNVNNVCVKRPREIEPQVIEP